MASEAFDPQGGSTYPNGCHVCEVEVDEADELKIVQPPGWRRRAHFYVTANRGATFVHYNIPGMSGLNRRIHHYLSRNITVPPPTQERRPGSLQKIA